MLLIKVALKKFMYLLLTFCCKDIISRLKTWRDDSIPKAKDFAKQYDHYRYVLSYVILLSFFQCGCNNCY